jgi:hypothetical protein
VADVSARVPKRWARRLRLAILDAGAVPSAYVLRAFLSGGGYRFASPEWFAWQHIIGRRMANGEPRPFDYAVPKRSAGDA